MRPTSLRSLLAQTSDRVGGMRECAMGQLLNITWSASKKELDGSVDAPEGGNVSEDFTVGRNDNGPHTTAK
jgi:hypothetical protein